MEPYSGFGFTGDGSAIDPFPAAGTGLALGQSYGWYLNNSATDFFSEPVLNVDGFDHLMTFDMSALAGTEIFVDDGSGAKGLTLGAATFLLG